MRGSHGAAAGGAGNGICCCWIGLTATTTVLRRRSGPGSPLLELADPELERYLLQAEHPLEAELPELPAGTFGGTDDSKA